MDIVGHTGKMKETIAAAEVLDLNLGRIIKEAEKSDYVLVVTADHGNAEKCLTRKLISLIRLIRVIQCRLLLWKKN